MRLWELDEVHQEGHGEMVELAPCNIRNKRKRSRFECIGSTRPLKQAGKQGRNEDEMNIYGSSCDDDLVISILYIPSYTYTRDHQDILVSICTGT